jgi:hypothetical protein
MTRKNALIISAGAFLAVVIGCALYFYLGSQKGPSEENRELKVDIAAREAPASRTEDVTEKPIEDVKAKEPESEGVSETPAVVSAHPSGEQIQAATVGEDTPARVDRPVIRRSAIALGVENREPIGVTQRVSVRQERAYCWMHVIDGQGGKVTVCWIGKGRRVAGVHLPVGSNSWRTWAYVFLKPSMIGPARVEILDESGKLLKTLSFEITE